MTTTPRSLTSLHLAAGPLPMQSNTLELPLSVAWELTKIILRVSKDFKGFFRETD